MLRWNSSTIPKNCLEAIAQLSSLVWQGWGRRWLSLNLSVAGIGAWTFYTTSCCYKIQGRIRSTWLDKKEGSPQNLGSVSHFWGWCYLSPLPPSAWWCWTVSQCSIQCHPKHPPGWHLAPTRWAGWHMGRVQWSRQPAKRWAGTHIRREEIHRPPCRKAGQALGQGLLVQKKSRQPGKWTHASHQTTWLSRFWSCIPAEAEGPSHISTFQIALDQFQKCVFLTWFTAVARSGLNYPSTTLAR